MSIKLRYVRVNYLLFLDAIIIMLDARTRGVYTYVCRQNLQNNFLFGQFTEGKLLRIHVRTYSISTYRSHISFVLNMESGLYRTLCFTWIVIMMVVNSIHSDIRVEVTTPFNPVVVGGILPFQCQLWNMQDDYGVMIARRINGQVQRLSVDNLILDSPVTSRAFLAIRTFTGGTKVYFLTMLNVSPLDQGQYWCTVRTMSHTGATTDLARDSMNVQIRSFPGKGNPSCTINPNKLVYEEGDKFELVCSSEKGSPSVQLKWSRLGLTDYFLPINSSTEAQVHSKVEITTNSIYQNTMFICEMSSQAFLDYKRSCGIGPIIITQQRSAAESPPLVTKRSKVTDFNTVDTQKTVTNDCSVTCESSSNTIFYLIISTMAASLLCLIFIITTTIMCCKYYNKSTEFRQRHQYIPTPPSQVADPVYRSIERRNDNELVYMTLEDPNNPEGKVLLPKEVFDEFYNRTLSLRKN